MCAQPLSPNDPTAVRPPEETPTVVIAAGARQALQLTPGAIVAARYRIVSPLGRGGMGEVYRADDLKLGQTVALKFLSHHAHAARLLEEVRIGRQVSHPNVCRLYDVAEAEGQLFITMEFVDGEDLASLLRRIGRLPSEKALAVGRDICAGLAAAHEKGVIHRDLKPANVMIDGRGRARVTDFGLAVAEDNAADGAGTPAYMAPEQLAGESASQASDIYALGLVLYEIFTGRRAFAWTTQHDLLMRQRASDYTRPSVVTSDVPAAVERVITRCLDPDPKSRPESLAAILHELPGGDPLALALAAGETPSPAMVAAAAKSGDLPAIAAWPMLALAVIGIAAGALMSNRTLLYRVSETKAPEVLQERARQILAIAGATERPRDSDIFVRRAGERLVAIYRQSASGMRARYADEVLTEEDPPLKPRMANVVLDGDGNLLRLAIAPPRVDRSAASGEPHWDALIAAAGYDPRSLTRTTPEWSADVDSDSKYAWLAKDGNRIEAAARRGKPVSFTVLSPAAYREAIAPAPNALADRLAMMMLITFMISIPITAIVLARMNLRRRQGDRAGAFRIALFFGAAAFTGFLFNAHHPMSFFDEWVTISWLIAQATFWAVNMFVFYIALEPLVRKRWPEMLISWTRLLAGRASDPMAGRDVLAGAAAAAFIVMVWHASLLVSQSMTVGPTATLGPVRCVIAQLAAAVCEALLRGFGMILFLLLMRAVVRNDDAASVLTVFFIAILMLRDAGGPLGVRAFYALTASFVGVRLARQFGVLAVMSYVFFIIVQQRLPVTLDSEAWYFGRSLVVMLLLIAVAAWAFRVSLGAKRWLPLDV